MSEKSYEKDWDSITKNLAMEFANHAQGAKAEAREARARIARFEAAGGAADASDVAAAARLDEEAATWERRRAIAAAGKVPFTDQDARDPEYSGKYLVLAGEASRSGRAVFGDRPASVKAEDLDGWDIDADD